MIMANICNDLALAGCSPEKAGVGGSIPSLATTLKSLESKLSYLFFCLCQICAVDFPDQHVLPVLILRRPLRIVTTDRGGAVPEDGCYFLKFSALP